MPPLSRPATTTPATPVPYRDPHRDLQRVERLPRPRAQLVLPFPLGDWTAGFLSDDDAELFELRILAPGLILRRCVCCPGGEPDQRSCLILNFLASVPPAPPGSVLP